MAKEGLGFQLLGLEEDPTPHSSFPSTSDWLGGIPEGAASCPGFSPKGNDCLDSALAFRSESRQTWSVSSRQASAYEQGPS